MRSPLELDKVSLALGAIRAEMIDAERRFSADWSGMPESHRASARNLLHYLALRRRDLRSLQAQLAAMGLSSLGRAESQALVNINAVIDLVTQVGALASIENEPAREYGNGRALLEEHTRALLGPPPDGRDVRIMVTMPGDAADDFGLVRDLLLSGMNCLRINTAHDDPDAWQRMLRNLDRARVETGRACRVLMDLGGPKLRTGMIEPGPAVVHWRPVRDVMGRVVMPARVWLTPQERPRAAPHTASAVLPVSSGWLAALAVGDTIKLFDARDSMRTMRIVETADGGAWGESDQSAYVLPGTLLQLTHDRSRPGAGGAGVVGDLPSTTQEIQLACGDRLVLMPVERGGTPAIVGSAGDVLTPATIGVTLPEVFHDVRPGESIWFDDGKIGGMIRSAAPERIEVEITHAKPGGSRLGSDKGINLPDSNLGLPALTTKDLADLRFIARHADLVGQSFVRMDSDVHELRARLAELGGSQLGIVLKIETRRAFENLPALLLAAMHGPSAGVMIARGDLAVECGFERLAEVQEEILWMAEASHMPVIWATQVLETLAKSGIPSRAEITDAAMGERAECVMLNKGPYILDALRALDGILRRMQTHQQKKSAMLRDLRLAERFFEGGAK